MLLQVMEASILMEVCGSGILLMVNGMILALLLAHKAIKVLKGKPVLLDPKEYKEFQVMKVLRVHKEQRETLVTKDLKG